MRNTRRAVSIFVVLALLTIGLAAPATAGCSGEKVEFTAVATMVLDEGEARVDGSRLHVRGARVAYGVVACTTSNCPTGAEYTINYTVDVVTGRGLIWGTWQSNEGIRGVHVGTISDFSSPQSFSFRNRSIGRGSGLLLILRGESATGGAFVDMRGMAYG